MPLRVDPSAKIIWQNYLAELSADRTNIFILRWFL